MSRKLGALSLALSILLGAMALKTVLTTGHSNGTTIQANGPAPVPPAPKPDPKQG